MVRAVHGAVPFALNSVSFTGIMFLDDVLDSPPTARLALDASSGVVSITSRQDGSAVWDAHSTMRLQLREEERGQLDLRAAQGRCTEHVSAATFYPPGTGNHYRGEFRSMSDAWGGRTGHKTEVLSRVTYNL